MQAIVLSVLSLVVAVASWVAAPSGLALARVALAAWGVGIAVFRGWVEAER